MNASDFPFTNQSSVGIDSKKMNLISGENCWNYLLLLGRDLIKAIDSNRMEYVNQLWYLPSIYRKLLFVFFDRSCHRVNSLCTFSPW
jgi:hypothetical protein